MKLIVGLGNPGLKYKATRHNIGFCIVELLAKRHKIRLSRHRFGAKIGRGLIGGRDTVLFLPQKFMNLSGGPLKVFIENKCGTEVDLLVVCDDINLNYGILRLKKAGAAGGHKGLKSVIESLSRDNFARLKVGIGKAGLKGDITGFVLGNWTKEEKSNLAVFLKRAAAACEAWISEGVESAANKFNVKI